MTKPKPHSTKREPKREKPDEHPKHENASVNDFEAFVEEIDRVPPPKKEK